MFRYAWSVITRRFEIISPGRDHECCEGMINAQGRKVIHERFTSVVRPVRRSKRFTGRIAKRRPVWLGKSSHSWLPRLDKGGEFLFIEYEARYSRECVMLTTARLVKECLKHQDQTVEPAENHELDFEKFL